MAIFKIFNEERFVTAPSKRAFPVTVSREEEPVMALKLILSPLPVEVIFVGSETVRVFPKLILPAVMSHVAFTDVVPV